MLILTAAEPPLVRDEGRVGRLGECVAAAHAEKKRRPDKGGKAWPRGLPLQAPVGGEAGRRPRPPFIEPYGNAKTQSTEPPSGVPISGVSVASDRAWLEPLPVAIATYCLPPTE